MESALQNVEQDKKLFGIFIRSIPVKALLPCDFYLLLGTKPVLFRKAGDTLTPERLISLKNHGVQKLHINTADKAIFRQFLWDLIGKEQADSLELEYSMLRQTGIMVAEAFFTEPSMDKALAESVIYAKKAAALSGQKNWKSIHKLMLASVQDEYSYNHAVDVSALAVEMTSRVFGKDNEMVWQAGLGAFIHDLGERLISPEVMKKKGGLAKEEWDLIHEHPKTGFKFVEPTKDIPHAAKLIVLDHHENFDGTGYPNKLAGEQISAMARIVSLCDVYDSLISDRPTRKKLSEEDALQFMESMQPGRFDPALFFAFKTVIQS